MKLASYTKEFGSLITKSVYTECRICSREMLHDYYSIKNHMRAHKELLGKQQLVYNYFIRYIQGTESESEVIDPDESEDESNPSCTKVDTVTVLSDEQGERLKKAASPVAVIEPITEELSKSCLKQDKAVEFLTNREDILEERPPSIKDESMSNPLLAEDLFSDNRLPETQLSVEELSRSWASKCVYLCKICNMLKPTPCKRSMIKHLSELHETDSASYEEKFGSLQASRVHTECKRCNELILHDYYSIWTHLVIAHKEKNHDQAVPKYFNEYIRGTQPDHELIEWKCSINMLFNNNSLMSQVDKAQQEEGDQNCSMAMPMIKQESEDETCQKEP